MSFGRWGLQVVLGLSATVVVAQSVLAQTRPVLTPEIALSTRRFVYGPANAWRQTYGEWIVSRKPSPIYRSPSDKTYLFVTLRGDASLNKVIAEVWAGSISDIASTTPRLVLKLETSALATPTSFGGAILMADGANPIKWVDDRSVALLWEDGAGTLQVYRIDLLSGALKQLTHEPRDVLSFAVSRGGALYYSALSRSGIPPQMDWSKGQVIQNADMPAVMWGYAGGRSSLDILWNTESFVRNSKGRTLPAQGARQVDTWRSLTEPQYSPDERWIISDVTPAEVPQSWRIYTESYLALSVSNYLDQSPASFNGRQLKRLTIVDANTGRNHPVWDAPITSRARFFWAPDSRSVLIVNTCLPPSWNVATCDRAAVIESVSGNTSVLPDITGEVTSVMWNGAAGLRIKTSRGALMFRRAADNWVAGDVPDIPNDAPLVRLVVQEDRNSPPKLVSQASDDAGGRVIFDPNPGLLDRVALGRVEEIQWKDRYQRSWSGLLFYPVDCVSGRRYPLVIQTHDYIREDRFTLYGNTSAGLGPGRSLYAGQLLTARNIAVLHVRDRNDPDAVQEAKQNMMGYESGAKFLSERGLADEDRIGISGFSRAGWWVLYALTHSDFKYRAAFISDNIDGSYLAGTLMPGANTNENGAAPYGKGLNDWMENAPGFNADRIRAPLRMNVESGGIATILLHWEVFARMRERGLPVEYYAVSDSERGLHGTQNPRQVLEMQQGVVDWFDFWLQGNEGRGLNAAGQYERWRILRDTADAHRD